jgi:hypothetical protein
MLLPSASQPWIPAFGSSFRTAVVDQTSAMALDGCLALLPRNRMLVATDRCTEYTALSMGASHGCIRGVRCGNQQPGEET